MGQYFINESNFAEIWKIRRLIGIECGSMGQTDKEQHFQQFEKYKMAK